MALLSRRTCFSLLVLTELALLAFRGVSAYQRGYGPTLGWGIRLFEDQTITSVEPGSPAALAGLRSGDKLVAFDDLDDFENPDRLSSLVRRIRRLAVGPIYHLRVVRDSSVLDFQVSTDYRGSSLARTKLLEYHSIGLVYLLFGLILLLLKPYNAEAMIFSAFMAGQSVCYVPALSTRFPTPAGIPLDILQFAFIFATPYLFIHFALIFPKPLGRNRPRKIFIGGLYALVVLQSIVYLIPKIVDLDKPFLYNRSAVLQKAATVSFNSFYIIFLIGCLIGVGARSLDLKWAESRQHKRKARLILFGMAIGLPPLVLLNGVAHFFGLTLQTTQAGIVGLLSLVFPAAFGYAIVKHRVMDVRLILRRSVKHLLISRLMLAVEAVLVVLVVYHLVSPFVQRITSTAGNGALVAGAVITYSLISLGLGAVNRRLSRILDRLFFRDAHGAEQLLVELAHTISSINDQKTLIREVSGELMRALSIERVSFLLPEKARLVDAGSNGKGKARSADPILGRWTAIRRGDTVDLTFEPGAELSAPNDFLKVVFSSSSPIEIDPDDSGSWIHRLPAAGRDFLAGMESNLLVPLRESGATIGVISLSGKLSDLPYTRDDMRLLESVAAQITTALERVWLLHEVTKQERLRREMEIATMVQSKLFPASISGSDAIEVIGACHPARSVGGDYYDFIQPCPGKLGIAIGDVSGKGISAALIMSTLQASLRSTASGQPERVADVVGIVNRLLCKSTDSDRFATFFYGLLDEDTATLTYVNAGHDPPVVLRYGPSGSNGGPSTVEVVRPSRGGLVLGVMDEFPYEQETIELRQGDILIGFTDGVTEAVNSRNEFYGEERLLELARRHLDMSAKDLHDLIIDDLRRFIGEMDQRDDITVIAIKLN